jgi:hypothetical protein
MEPTTQLLEEWPASSDGAEQIASTNGDALRSEQCIRFDGFFTGPTW